MHLLNHRQSVPCCGTLQYKYAGDTAPRPLVNRHPPAPTNNDTVPHQTPHIQIPGCHHDCVSQGGGSERCHTTTSYPNLGNDCCVCSRYRTTHSVLRPKCYAFLCTGKVNNNLFQHTNPVEKKTAKNVKRYVKDAHLQFAHYLDALNNFHTYLCRQNLIKSTLHTVRTVNMCKVDLTAYDTKRWMCDDTIHSHAHGHRSTLL